MQTINALTIGQSRTLNLSVSNPLTITNLATFDSGSTLDLSGSIATLPDLLMTYSGSANGTFSNGNLNGSSILQLGDALVYSSGSLELISAGPSHWTASSGSWSTAANWIGPPPNNVGQPAVLNQSTSGAVTITLDKPVTLGSLQFGNSSGMSTSYTLSGSLLTLNNSVTGSFASVTVLGGTHTISTPVEIAGGGLAVSASNSSLLNISGNISDDNGGESLTLKGDGTGQLILSGTDNTYGGGTNVEEGTLIVQNSGAILPGSSLTVGAGGVFIFDPTVTGASSASASPSVTVAAVPEPGTIALLLAALWSAAIYRRFSKRPIPRQTHPRAF